MNTNYLNSNNLNSSTYYITIPGIYNMFDNTMKKIGYLLSDPINNDKYFEKSVNRVYFSISRFISVANIRIKNKSDLSYSEKNDFKSMVKRMMKLKKFFEEKFIFIEIIENKTLIDRRSKNKNKN